MCAFGSHSGAAREVFALFGAPMSPPWPHFRPLVAPLGCVLDVLTLRFGSRWQILVLFRAFLLILVVFGGMFASF